MDLNAAVFRGRTRQRVRVARARAKTKLIADRMAKALEDAGFIVERSIGLGVRGEGRADGFNHALSIYNE